MSTQNANVPTIDISPLILGSDQERMLRVAKEIDAACRDSGFFLISKHGLENVLPKLLEVTKNFHFNLTDEDRWKLAIVAYNKENTRQIRNGYYLPIKGKKAVESYCYLNPSFTHGHPKVNGNISLHEINVWPDEKKFPGFKEFNESYYNQMFQMTSALLYGFALALGKNFDFFQNYYKKEDTLSSVRLIRYPYLDDYPPVKTAEDGTKISFDSHVDVSLLTVLYQPYVANLQVETSEGYKDIPSSDDCYLVNVGGYMEYITNGYYKSPVHRVKFVNAERLSLPYFVMLGYDSKIDPFTPREESDAIDKPSNSAKSYGEWFEQARLDLIVKNGQT